MDIADGLNALFAGQNNPFSLDMQGNKIAMFSNADTAATATGHIQSGDTSLITVGFGGSVHNGSHTGYNQFLIVQVGLILNSDLSAANQRMAIWDLHQFATQLSQGTVVVDGQTLGVMGLDFATDFLFDGLHQD